MNKGQKGFSLHLILMIIVVFVAVLGSGWYVWRHQHLKTVAKAATVATLPKSATQPAKPASTEAFIVSNPLDLSQISAITKFRSCYGHDYSGKDAAGVMESNRSMKHYFRPVDSLSGSVGRVKVLSPFNGAIEAYQYDHDPRGKQLLLTSPTTDWTFIVFHIDLLSGLSVGSSVTAGQLLGYANIGNAGGDFDMAVKKFPYDYNKMQSLINSMTPDQQQQYFMSHSELMETFDSLFNHMSPQVLSQYTAKGATVDSLIVTPAYRDAHPCNFSPGSENPADWVKLD